MISSPFMVVYGNLLLVLQYIWSFELPEIKKVPGFLEKKDPGELASKVNEQENQKKKMKQNHATHNNCYQAKPYKNDLHLFCASQKIHIYGNLFCLAISIILT